MKNLSFTSAKFYSYSFIQLIPVGFLFILLSTSFEAKAQLATVNIRTGEEFALEPPSGSSYAWSCSAPNLLSCSACSDAKFIAPQFCTKKSTYYVVVQYENDNGKSTFTWQINVFSDAHCPTTVDSKKTNPSMLSSFSEK